MIKYHKFVENKSGLEFTIMSLINPSEHSLEMCHFKYRIISGYCFLANTLPWLKSISFDSNFLHMAKVLAITNSEPGLTLDNHMAKEHSENYQSPLILTELFQPNLINVSYLTACYLYQVMMTLHFLNDVANDAESTQKIKNYVIIASLKSV